MRLYLSSYGLGNRPEELLTLLKENRRAALVLNAKDAGSEESRARSLAQEIESLEALGLEPTELDLRNYFGNPASLKEVLKAFDLVWVRGGNAFVLRRALRQSGADEILAELLTNDRIVYGGFSAGVVVLAPSMAGLETVDDPFIVPPGYDPEPVWEGLGLLPYAVAPHYRSDHPESVAVEGLVQQFIDDHQLFTALRDGEAIVIHDDRHEVIT